MTEAASDATNAGGDAGTVGDGAVDSGEDAGVLTDVGVTADTVAPMDDMVTPPDAPDTDAGIEADAGMDVDTVRHDAEMDTGHDAGGRDAGGHDATPDVVHCTAPRTDCAGSCVDLATDAHDCGACGHACPTGARCVGRTCTLDAACAPLRFPDVMIQTWTDAAMTG